MDIALWWNGMVCYQGANPSSCHFTIFTAPPSSVLGGGGRVTPERPGTRGSGGSTGSPGGQGRGGRRNTGGHSAVVASRTRLANWLASRMDPGGFET